MKKPSPSALTGYHVGALSWLNWTLEMLVFEEGGKLDYQEINPWSKARNNNKLPMSSKLQIGCSSSSLLLPKSRQHVKE